METITYLLAHPRIFVYSDYVLDEDFEEEQRQNEFRLCFGTDY